MKKIELRIIKSVVIIITLSVLYYSIKAIGNFFEFLDLYFYTFSAFMYLNGSLILLFHLFIGGVLIYYLYYGKRLILVNSFKKIILIYLLVEILTMFLTDIAFYSEGYELTLYYPFYIQRILFFGFYFLTYNINNSVIFVSTNIRNFLIPIPVIYLISVYVFGYDNLGYDLMAFVRDLILVGSTYYLIFNSNLRRDWLSINIIVITNKYLRLIKLKVINHKRSFLNYYFYFMGLYILKEKSRIKCLQIKIKQLRF